MYEQIIISSRIRLARNLKDYVFPHNLTENNADEVLNMVFNACDNIGNFNNYKLRNIKDEVLQENLEDHLISQKLIENANISGVCVSSDSSVSVMVNEEDHLREQCTLKGLNLKKAYDIINDIDNELSMHLNFAYDEQLGYLTACPTNLGTGIRASVILFLPALTMTNNMEQVIDTVTKLGIRVRGTYGENSSAKGYLFQINNQNSLGKTESEIIQHVESTVLKICELEQKAREQLLSISGNDLNDDVMRSFGVLTNCYKISSQEATELLSKVKLGLGLKIINLKTPEVIDDLLNNVSAVKINKLSNKNLNSIERDVFRAEYLNRVLKNIRIN